MCDYQGHEFGAGSYPDSVCIDGRLFDADNCDGDGNLYENEEDIPCPICRPTEAVQWWVEQSSSFEDSRDGDALCAATARVENIRSARGVFDEFETPTEAGGGR
ncbi:MAG: hypothetical protein ACRCTX_26380 [Afipia sp.]